MNSLELMNKVLSMEIGERIPFCPAIYEHKGFLIGKTPSEICRDPDLLVEGLLAEYERYKPDFLTVGIDVYNVEAEALGCKIVYFDDSPDVPGVEDFPIKKLSDIDKLSIPDPTKDGRMPLYLEAAKKLHAKLGHEIKIRGAITGPFSLASELMGAENFIVMTMQDPQYTVKLMEFTARVAAAFGKAFVDIGIDPIIFDSRAMPPLCSPQIFQEIVSKVYKRILIPELKAAGAKQIPLIIGGDTTPILDAIIDTDTTQILCDFEGDIELFKKKALENNLPMRVNVDPRLLHLGPIDKIQDFTMNILNKCWDHPGFILGTGVAAYDCPPEHIDAVRACLEKDYKNWTPTRPIFKQKKQETEAIVVDTEPTYEEGLEPILRELAEAIEEGEEDDVVELVQEALEDDIPPGEIVDRAMIPAMDVIGYRFAQKQLFVPEMLIAARAMSEGLKILRPLIAKTGAKPVGRVLLGTVKGDIHDIGKNLVGMMLEGAGFQILDLGVNVPVEKFIAALKENDIHMVGMSALLTTTMNYMERVIQALKDEGMRDTVKVLIGGAPINEKFCDKIDADYYADSAADGVIAAKRALADLKALGISA
ncbi:uroporphyrinogen decarboxylase family protein [Pelagicoccus sp. SDUM812005]|uniref:uroporphyrinogen decarboxylase family protein n=1 Tax=Pelagicoccus sp. SDUM812005 TaxID=3041257 RepID=UPI00280F5DE2|nr:uroporphyrinogen decarboxylase family protein [Pelagicoccus sp. SDUM812005]MDQ8183673.1 uroporphyrinogen decarboxylase family protein [Pelagicoccus sp. SDUM812005]